MKAIELVNAEIDTVSSRQDGSVAFRVITAELRPSEAGLVLQYHGKACRVTVFPHEGTPEEVVSVDTERDSKTPSQRWRGVLFVAWTNKVDRRDGEDFEAFYRRQYAKLIDFWKAKLPQD